MRSVQIFDLQDVDGSVLGEKVVSNGIKRARPSEEFALDCFVEADSVCDSVEDFTMLFRC